MPENIKENEKINIDFSRLASSLNDQFANYLTTTVDFVQTIESRSYEVREELETQKATINYVSSTLESATQNANEFIKNNPKIHLKNQKDKIEKSFKNFDELFQLSQKHLIQNHETISIISKFSELSEVLEKDSNDFLENLLEIQSSINFPGNGKLMRELFEKAELNLEKRAVLISKLKEFKMETVFSADRVSFMSLSLAENNVSISKVTEMNSNCLLIISKFREEIKKLNQVSFDQENKELVI